MNSYWWFRPSQIALFAILQVAYCAFLASNPFYQQFAAFGARVFPGSAGIHVSNEVRRAWRL